MELIGRKKIRPGGRNVNSRVTGARPGSVKPELDIDIAEPFDLALNAVTKHFKLLERAGLIRRERQGREVLMVSGLPTDFAAAPTL